MKAPVLALSLTVLLQGCGGYGTGSGGPLYIVPVEPAALVGEWFEVASFPGPFQRGCSNTTATYSPLDDGSLAVVNRCLRDGKLVDISGVASAVAPGRLKVRLDGTPFAGDYWVLGQSDDGETVFVGTPTRIAGWVLSRDRTFSAAEARAAEAIFSRNGYDTSALRETVQDQGE